MNDVLSNYLKIAVRNLRRRPGNSTINIIGPAVGLTTCTVIGLYVAGEIGFDRFHDDANRLGPTGNRTYVYIFLTVALFVLVMACVNFVNLSTAQAADRAAEIGVRKVLGSRRASLVVQFLTESTLIALLASFIALALTSAAVAMFNSLMGVPLDLNLLTPVWVLPAVVLISIAIGLVAGVYPGIYPSALQPIGVLQGRRQRGGMRQVLVVTQFALTMGLLVCTFVVHRQTHCLKNADLGFEREGILTVSNRNDVL